MTDLSAWCGIASNAAFAVDLAYLGSASLTEPGLSRRIGFVALATAALGVLIIVVGQVGGLTGLQNVISLITGVVLSPVIAIGLGERLSRFLSGVTAADQGRAKDDPQPLP